MANENILQNRTKSIYSQCKVVVYLWNFQTLLESKSKSELAQTTPFDISSRIMNVSVNKTMGAASGTFSITVANNADFQFKDDEKRDVIANIGQNPGVGDWKDLIRRGTWCTIYLSQDRDLDTTSQIKTPRIETEKHRRKLRHLCLIERVAPKIELNEKGAFDVVYELSGRDFGVIYEDAVIWHNLFNFDNLLLQKASAVLRPTQRVGINRAIDVLHDLFLYPPGIGIKEGRDGDNSLVSTALQWLMPSRLLRDLGIRFKGSIPYWGATKEATTNFQQTAMGFTSQDLTEFLSGSVWSRMNSIAVREFHELYTEVLDGVPTLTFRPIPWSITDEVRQKYPTAAPFIQKYKDVESVLIEAIDVVTADLAEDNQNRYNSFLCTTSGSIINKEDNISILKPDFPEFNQNSIRRYGFKPMHVDVPALTNNESRKNGLSDLKLLKEYNHVLKDYYQLAIYGESGTVEIIGNPDIKVGKCLTFDADVPYISGKRYYIEGYTDNFTVLENGAGIWTQSVALTRGFENKDLNQAGRFSARDNEFKQQGEYTPSGRSED